MSRYLWAFFGFMVAVVLLSVIAPWLSMPWSALALMACLPLGATGLFEWWMYLDEKVGDESR